MLRKILHSRELNFPSGYSFFQIPLLDTQPIDGTRGFNTSRDWEFLTSSEASCSIPEWLTASTTMARMRKEKGQSSKTRHEPKKPTGKSSADGILPFVGNQKDAELLKGLDENVVTGSVNKDVSSAIYVLIDVLITLL